MLAAERGAAPNTLEAYRRDLDHVSAFLTRRGRALADARSADLRAYLAALGKAGLAPRTAARRLSALRQFYRFLLREGLRGDDPAQSIESPRRGRPLPKILSEAEVDRLLAAAAQAEGAAGLRLAALVELLYATGLRVSELVGLPHGAVARDPQVLVVRGKGGRERMVPLSEPAREALRRYLAVRAQFAGPDGSRWLFPSRAKAGHLTRHRFGQLLKGLALETGLDPAKVSPHVSAPRLRQPPARPRRRPALGAKDARPRRHLDHPDLHPRAQRASARPGPGSSPPGAKALLRRLTLPGPAAC